MATTAALPMDAARARRRSSRRAASTGRCADRQAGCSVALVGLALLAGCSWPGSTPIPAAASSPTRSQALEFDNGMKIGVGRIDGSLYGAMTLRDLTLSDPKGVFLSSRRGAGRLAAVRLSRQPCRRPQPHRADRDACAGCRSSTPRRRATRRCCPISTSTSAGCKVDRLIIEPPVTGERRVGSIDGRAQIADRRAQVALQAAAIGGDGPRRRRPARAQPRRGARSQPARARRLTLSAPAGGVVATLAGLTAPLSVRVNGRGDWQRWDGRLLADLDNAPLARLALSARDGTFGVRGPTRVARLVEGPTAALLGPITNRRAAIDLGQPPRRPATAASRATPSRSSPTASPTLAATGSTICKLNFALLKPRRAGAQPCRPRPARRADARRRAAPRRRVDYRVDRRDARLQRHGAAGARRARRRAASTAIRSSSRSPPRRASDHRARRRGRRHDSPTSGSTATWRSTGRGSCRTICASARTGSMPRRSSSPTSPRGSTPARSTAGSTIIGSTASASSTSTPTPT